MALARAVLDAFVKQSSPFDVTMTPAHRFVKDQAVAFAKHIADQMTKEHLTVNHFLDGIENLFFLGLFWRNRDESVAKVSTRSQPRLRYSFLFKTILPKHVEIHL